MKKLTLILITIFTFSFVNAQEKNNECSTANSMFQQLESEYFKGRISNSMLDRVVIFLKETYPSCLKDKYIKKLTSDERKKIILQNEQKNFDKSLHPTRYPKTSYN